MNIIFFFDIRYIFLWINICLSYYAYNNNIYCKNKLDSVYYSLMWFLLKLCSKIEIIYNNLKKTDVKNFTIKVIKDGDIVEIYDSDSLKKYHNQEMVVLENNKNNKNNDYPMILGEYNDGKNIKVVRYNNNNININSDYYIKSEVKLLGIQLKIINNNELKETIPLTFDKNYNYFMENNILFDRKFINYFLKKEKKTALSSDDKYKIVFFDDNINCHTIIEPQYIKINKKNFEIINKENDINCHTIAKPQYIRINKKKFEIINKENDTNVKLNFINTIKKISWIGLWAGPIYASNNNDNDSDEDY